MTSSGEQPIFSTKAHVFQIDAGTKKDWVPASSASVSVSYYYDSTRNTYRIISVDGSKAIVNSTITPNMTFTKTSQKFGQWSDPRANTVYGLGFASEQDLSKFIEKFKEVKEMTRQVAQLKQSEMNGGVDSHPTSPQPSGRQPLHQRTNSLSSIQNDSGSLRERRNSFTQGGGGTNGVSPNPSSEAQLKYENDRLKLALAQSSANAKKWEVELQTLKNNNARLTAALQESTANVEEWKKQLAAYKEESARLKKRNSSQVYNYDGKQTVDNPIAEQKDQLIGAVEKSGMRQKIMQRKSAYQPIQSRQFTRSVTTTGTSTPLVNSMRPSNLLDQDKGGGGDMVVQLTDQLERIRLDNQKKQEEIKNLGSQIEELQSRDSQLSALQVRIQALEEENHHLTLRMQDSQRQNQEGKSLRDQEHRDLIKLQDTVGSKLTELYEIHETIMATLKHESHS